MLCLCWVSFCNLPLVYVSVARSYRRGKIVWAAPLIYICPSGTGKRITISHRKAWDVRNQPSCIALYYWLMWIPFENHFAPSTMWSKPKVLHYSINFLPVSNHCSVCRACKNSWNKEAKNKAGSQIPCQDPAFLTQTSNLKGTPEPQNLV